jgi:hypothetical protein
MTSTTNQLADSVGAMDTALSHIADELHTALVELDEINIRHDRLDRLAAYVVDVQARTAPAHPPIILTPQLAADLAATTLALRDRIDGAR